MPRAIHAQVRVEREADIEADQQVLALGIDAIDPGCPRHDPWRTAGPAAGRGTVRPRSTSRSTVAVR